MPTRRQKAKQTGVKAKTPKFHHALEIVQFAPDGPYLIVYIDRGNGLIRPVDGFYKTYELALGAAKPFDRDPKSLQDRLATCKITLRKTDPMRYAIKWEGAKSVF